jgi:hypothetical protein
MIKVTFSVYSAKRAIGLILDSNNLKNAVKILYPNRLIVSEGDVKAIERVLAPALIKGVYTPLISK